MPGACGSRLARSFRMSNHFTLTAHPAGKHPLADTELICDIPDDDFSRPIASGPLRIVGRPLRDSWRHGRWLDRRSVPLPSIIPGVMRFHDPGRNPIGYVKNPFHPLFFHVPRIAPTELRVIHWAPGRQAICATDLGMAVHAYIVPLLHAAERLRRYREPQVRRPPGGGIASHWTTNPSPETVDTVPLRGVFMTRTDPDPGDRWRKGSTCRRSCP